MIINNFGAVTIYGFALNTKPMEMECRTLPSQNFTACEVISLCKRKGTPGFEYRANQSQPGYYYNWWLQYDLVCEDQSDIKKTVSYQFVGFICGLPMMVMPDQMGRKKSMILALIVSIFAVYLCIYGKTLEIKSWGFFIHGMFHIRITIAFTHLIELVDNANKDICQTVLTFFDTFSIAIMCLWLQFVDNNLQRFLNVYFTAGLFSIVVYVLIIPESPRWLLLRDPASAKGKRVLNYIAWFNGSKRRIPDHAVMDNLDQVLLDKQHANQSIIGNVSMRINMTLNETVNNLTLGGGTPKTKSKLQLIFSDFKGLFCNRKQAVKQL